MSRRRRHLLEACEGDRTQVRLVENDLARKSVARRRMLRRRRERLRAHGYPRPDHLKGVE